MAEIVEVVTWETTDGRRWQYRAAARDHQEELDFAEAYDANSHLHPGGQLNGVTGMELAVWLRFNRLMALPLVE